MSTLNDLPEVLLPYKDKIMATLKPVINITLTPTADLPLWASKVGGKPYLPKDVEYPMDAKGNPLSLLAQFNMADLPENELLPKTGMLSFFIRPALDDTGAYGVDFENLMNQDGFRVLYFDKACLDTNELMTDFCGFEQAWQYDAKDSPLFDNNKNYLINFTLTSEMMPVHDYGVARHFFDLGDYYDIFDVKGDDKKLIRFLQKNDSTYAHKLLGYPFFAQHDPRIEHHHLKDYILLFQLSSDEDCAIMWGDSGVGNFFIHPDDLKKLDFSKVAYSADCF